MAGTYGLTGTLTPAAANTANQILWGVVSGAAAGDGVITWLDVTCDAGALAAGIKVELFRATSGIPTAATYTELRLSSDAQTDSGLTSMWVCSGSTPVTASPGGVTVLKTWYMSPAGGLMVQYPLGREDYIVAGTTNWIGLRISTPALVGPNVAYNLAWAE